MSHFASKIKRDGSRRWKRRNATGFVRPQRNFFRAKMRLFRQMQKALQHQMRESLVEQGIVPADDKLEVTEMPWMKKGEA